MMASVGRIVHFVMPDGQDRPALIVRTWPAAAGDTPLIQLQVFVDGRNDEDLVREDEHGASTVWRTSVEFDAGSRAIEGVESDDPAARILARPARPPRAGTWHWPERT